MLERLMKRSLIWIGAATLLALPASAEAQQNYRPRRGDADLRSVDTTVALARGGAVSLAIHDGEIAVTGWDRDEVRVSARAEGGVRFRATASRVTVEVDGMRRGSDARFEITVPRGTRVSARAQSGDITIHGSRGTVEAGTQNGDIEIGDAVGRVEAGTLSGNVTIAKVEGDVKAGTVSGDVGVRDVKGEIEIGSVSGDIDVAATVARFVRVAATSGDLAYRGTIDPQGSYELATHSGDVEIALPQNVGAQISVSTWSGSVESEFPITLKPGEHGIGSASAKRFTFEVGNGAARINLESFSGDITITTTTGRTGK